MPFVDSRGMLPQELGGGHAGLPCMRRRPFNGKRDLLPDVVRPPAEKDGFALPGAGAEHRPEYTSFSGTQNLPWAMARSRSMGALTSGSILDKVLKHREKTDLDVLVDVMSAAVREDRPQDIRAFRQPYNAHRHEQESIFLTPELRKKKVIQVLQKFPLLHLYDLATVSPEHWSNISRELGGLTHGAVMKVALEYVQQNMSPMDRAAFWSATGNRQRSSDQNRQMGFAANSTFRGPNLHRWEDVPDDDCMLSPWERIPTDRMYTSARPGGW
mmetsp:Transcript_50283/g.144657  ORF Transcript_50283/g.144657 Transcript_50283/m.144657 type:complete len:271 (-) Transcript_50283:25-837(-)